MLTGIFPRYFDVVVIPQRCTLFFFPLINSFPLRVTNHHHRFISVISLN